MIKKVIAAVMITFMLLVMSPDLSGEKKVVLKKKRVKLYAGRKLLYLTKKLSLTAEQQKKIRVKLYEMEEWFMNKRAEIKIMEFRLALFIKNNNDNRKEIAEKIRAIYDKKSDFAISLFDYMIKLHSFLTPEQKKILEREMEHQEDRRRRIYHRDDRD